MRKLRDRRGITLTEMLCTVLIVLLLTALLHPANFVKNK